MKWRYQAVPWVLALLVLGCEERSEPPSPPAAPIPLQMGAIREQVRYVPKEHLEQRVKPAAVFRAKARERAGLPPGRVLLAIADVSGGLRDVVWEATFPDRAAWEADRAKAQTVSALQAHVEQEGRFPVEAIRRAVYAVQQPCGTYRGDGARVVGRNSYYPAEGRRAAALTLRLRANEVRRNLGRPPGCVWIKVEGDPEAPYLEWDVDYVELTADEQKAERVATTSTAFSAVLRAMKAELERFEAVMWRVHREVTL